MKDVIQNGTFGGLRILMTADTVGGVWTYAMELTRALQQYGIEVVLAAMGGPLDEHQQTQANRLDNLTVFESDYKLEWMEEPWTDVQEAGRWLLHLADRVKPDLVHLNNYAHGVLPWQVPTLLVGHSCVFSWFRAVKKKPPSIKWGRYKRTVASGLRRADLVTAPTEAMLTALRRHYGSFGTGKVVYNGRRRALFNPAPKAPYVLTAGRLWDDAKNVAALEEIAPRLSWPVHVAGAEKHPDSGKQVQFDNMRLLGRLPSSELADRMSHAAIFALPARYEPFGLTPLEAGLSGCALVLGDIPSQREVWGEAARFVPPDDPPALEATLQMLIENQAMRQHLAHRARERALSFTPTRMARHYTMLYSTLLPAHQPAQKL